MMLIVVYLLYWLCMLYSTFLVLVCACLCALRVVGGDASLSVNN